MGAQEGKLKVAVLMGGVSGEREVSLKSGKAVADALRQVGHEVVPIDVRRAQLSGLAHVAPDAVFIALHGAFGEDGQVQQILEAMDVPYVGSGPRASRLAMDKRMTKRALVLHAVSTPDYVAVGPDTSPQAAADEAARFGLPLVCKPSAAGSSLGVQIVRDADQLAGAVLDARRYGDTVILERYVPGREFTVGVLEGEALPMVELIVRREFFDYTAKYDDEGTRYVVPVSLMPTLYRRACDMAVRTWHALGCRHMARVDLIYGFDGSLNVLEANTIPGFTARSLLPMAAAQAGIGFPELCDQLVRAALRDAAADTDLRRRTA